MDIMVIGSGGREHALCWKIAQSSMVEQIYCAPGNAGTTREYKIQNAEIEITHADSLTEFAISKNVGLVVIGPELPIYLGLTDKMRAAGLRVFGPSRSAGRLEWSKEFAKRMCWSLGINTPHGTIASNYEMACQYIDDLFRSCKKIVVKPDGLTGGKGVVICANAEQAKQSARAILQEKIYDTTGQSVILEECIDGKEVSYQIFTDGEKWWKIPPSRDFKRWDNRPNSPNTGGLAALAPVALSAESDNEISVNIIEPILAEMRRQGSAYRGVLYVGLMMAGGKPYVLEFNCRLGDPEAQAILPLIETDIVPLMIHIADCDNGRACSTFDDELVVKDYYYSAAIVATSADYPIMSEYPNEIIYGMRRLDWKPQVHQFHSGTKYMNKYIQGGGYELNILMTNGGRVLTLTGVGMSKSEAIREAYNALGSIIWPGMNYKKRIRTIHYR